MYENIRVTNLIEYVKGLRDNEDGAELYYKYKDDIVNVKPQEAFEVFKNLLDQGIESKEILVFLGKVINAFNKSLSVYHWEMPKNDNFLKDMYLENEGLVKKTDEIKVLIKSKDALNIKKQKIIPKVVELNEFMDHYLKKENILFPYMEKVSAKFEGTKIMWSLHDEVRNLIKTTEKILQDENSSLEEVNLALANLFFGILGVKKKEELILYPAASEVLSESDWYEIHKQSLEYNFPFINKIKDKGYEDNSVKNHSGGKFKTETGELTFEEISLIFNNLPVDMTFVDENNKVRYFTRPKDRIFPRSPAVIGRTVNNCHPPESVHIVEEIVESFRSGKEDTAKFWIDLKGKNVLIQYFALRDSEGNYKGVLEVSQDITEIKSLEGERRLLKWGQ